MTQKYKVTLFTKYFKTPLSLTCENIINYVYINAKNKSEVKDIIYKRFNDRKEILKIEKMTEHILVEILGNFVRYTCPNCGAVIELHEYTKDMFIENDLPYFCEDCNEPIKLK